MGKLVGGRAAVGVGLGALLRYVRCMREHGVADFPDPQADGRFPLPASLREGKTPSFLRANQVCRQLHPNPKGRLEFHG